ncbi:hypothetical protein [Asanoa iriomotensis]|uniref:Uncharacterized protein n=1 Tax=Asanoa iriomotensis TaxID=234613 RepID=A0ABQ4CGV1_9ACTN|nr:hypothetical protein [Asanoa iriomotensis]GIF61540.1 hypothetical protein Air01nite_76350 [Asanoa iriomotensis]
MAGARPFGEPSTIAVVDAPVSAAYARKARVAFVAVTSLVATLTGVVSALFWHPMYAVAVGLAAGLVCGCVAAVLVFVWPVLRVLWRWSVELTALMVLVLGPALLARTLGPWYALMVVAAVAVTVFAVRPVRRRLSAWSWCLVVKHRLRVVFAEIVRGASRSRSGALPLILWARPTPAGARVWLWLRPGLDLSDLEGKAGRVAVACWAGEARIVRASERFAALVRVDLSRRNPFIDLVPSPLAALLAHIREPKPSLSAVAEPVGLDLADVDEPVTEAPSRGGRR